MKDCDVELEYVDFKFTQNYQMRDANPIVHRDTFLGPYS